MKGGRGSFSGHHKEEEEEEEEEEKEEEKEEEEGETCLQGVSGKHILRNYVLEHEGLEVKN
jgi:hypothetical protein